MFSSPLKAASPQAQSVYDPTVVARPILKKDAPFVLPAAPLSRPPPTKKPIPVPARADPRFNPVRIAKSEASLSTRIFLQTKPHAGEAVVGAQRFLALNRDSELRQFKRQLVDTATVSVAIGTSHSSSDYLQDDYGASSAAEESPLDGFNGHDAAAHAEDSDGAAELMHSSDQDPQYPVDPGADDGYEYVEHDASSSASDDEIERLLSANDDASEEQHSHRSQSAASETDSLASSHSATISNANADILPSFAVASAPEISITPARNPSVVSPLPGQRLHSSSKKDIRKHTPVGYSALHAARISPPVTANLTSGIKMASLVPASDSSVKASRHAIMSAAPPSFAELSKYSQHVVHELTNTQQMELQSGAKNAQKDLLRLRDSFQRVFSADSAAKQLSKSSSSRVAAKSQASSAQRDSKHSSHLDEPTPPRSRKPVPNTVVSKPARMSNTGLYDIDEADCSTPSGRSGFAAITPKQHRAASLVLPSVSPFFQTPERPSIFVSQIPVFSTFAPRPVALQIPIPAVDSVPCTPRPLTPPQPMKHHASVENGLSSMILHHPQIAPALENFQFRDLEAPQAPPFPDIFPDRSAHVHGSPSKVSDVHVESPQFEPLFELTDDREHDVFAAISALSAPLDSLVAPRSRFDPRLWLSVIDSDADIGVRIERLRAAYLVLSSLVQKDEVEVCSSFKRLNELRVDLLWQTKRRQLRFWLNSSGHIVMGPRKKEVVMRFLGLTPASKHTKSFSVSEPSPGCPGVSVQKRWQGSDFKIQLMLSLVSKYQLHLAFVQFKMNAAHTRAIRHVAACLSIAHGRRYILLGWSCLRSWQLLRTRTREVAIKSGSNKWFYYLQMVLRSWAHFVAARTKRKRSAAKFQHSKDSQLASTCFKRWSGSLRIRKHGNALASVACQFWYLTCSLRCILRWWQGAQVLAARKQALRAFAGSNSGNVALDSKHLPSEGLLKSHSPRSKTEVDEQLRLKRSLAIRRRKELLTPLKM